jgi:DNA modification methylase
MDDVQLMLGDCLERMAEIPDGSVDLIAADLPYGTTACRWDSVIPFEPMWAHFKRVLRPNGGMLNPGGGVVLTAAQPFAAALVMSNPKWFRNEWVWHKTQSRGHLNAKRQPLTEHENVLVFGKVSPTYNPQIQPKPAKDIRPVTPRGKQADCYGRYGAVSERSIPDDMSYPRSVIRIANPNHGEAGFHPTQKPVALFEYLIRTYSNEGETVLDCTMGSGTTGVACLNTGRRFIGIEKDPDYFATAERRIAAERSKVALFA